jgi:DNA-binding transcriptional ArsR family regulator
VTGIPHPGTSATATDLPRLLAVLASPLRLQLLRRLAQPAFVADLVAETGLTRQALSRHLDELLSAGLLSVRRVGRPGGLRATQYAASPTGLFAVKEELGSVELQAGLMRAVPMPTRAVQPPRPDAPSPGAGLLVIHGDAQGRWHPLSTASEWTLGRDPRAELPLSYDPFASALHAHLRLEGGTWLVRDLRSRNGTTVNFEALPAGQERVLRHGDVLGVGRSLFLFRSE